MAASLGPDFSCQHHLGDLVLMRERRQGSGWSSSSVQPGKLAAEL